jgi:glycosyltransferase involved in cell wall biosynthesis
VFSSDLLDASGWSPGVFYRGRLSKVALAEELAQASVMAYPSTLSETFCTSVAEAQAAGVPVVCAAKAALAERVTHGVDGLLVEGDASTDAFGDRFVDEIVRLMQNDARRARMGMAAIETARRDYAWPGIAKQWEDELSALTEGRRAAEPPVPDVDLTDDSLLEVRDRGRRATVPAHLAEDWLQRAWSSYGFEASVRVHA